jgi:branched-chain amino acid transport system permease protein
MRRVREAYLGFAPEGAAGTMSDAYILQQLLNGLVLGSLYALIAVGFTMIYGIVRLINFAHGDILMVGAFSAFAMLTAFDLPLWSAIVAVLTIGAILAMLIDLVAFRPQRAAPQVNGFITSLGVSILMQNLAVLLLSGQPRPFNLPSLDARQRASAGGPADHGARRDDRAGHAWRSCSR